MNNGSSLKIFVASSGELKAEREKIILLLNDLGKTFHNLHLEPVEWETDLPSGSIQKQRFQDEINPLLDPCPVVLVLVYSKIGEFTLEEYRLARAKNKKVFLYFKTGFSPKNKTEIKAYAKVLKFREEVEKENQLLFQDYDTLDALHKLLYPDLNLYLAQTYPTQVRVEPAEPLAERLLKGSLAYYHKLRGSNGRFKNLCISELILPNTKTLWLDTRVSITPPKTETSKETSPVADALACLWSQDIPHAVILGDGGMGKTVSLLLWWQQLLEHRDKNSPVPIYIALNEFNQIPESNRHDFILTTIRKNYADEHTTLNHIEKTLALAPQNSPSHPLTLSPSFLFLLDGFNEITVEKGPLLLELKRLQECCPGIQLVLTSRYDMRAVCNWSDWFLLQMLPLTDEQVHQYLAPGQPLPQTLRPLLQNPMMLTLYAATCEVQKNFATSPLCHFKPQVETTAELLWNFIEAQVAKLPERVARDEGQVYYYKFLLQFLLPALGLAMEKAGLFDFTRRQLHDVLDKICGEFSSTDFYQTFPEFVKYRKNLPLGVCVDAMDSLERSTVLTENLTHTLSVVVEEESSFRFLHQNFRDFFAAVGIVNQVQISLQKQEIPWVLKERNLDIFVRRMIGELEGEFRHRPYFKPGVGWCIERNQQGFLSKVLELCRGQLGHEDRGKVGYAVWNIVTIYKEVRGELSGMDLSGLDLTGLTLNGVRCSRYYKNSYLASVFDGARLHEQNLLPQRHMDEVTSAVYSPDGQKILSASDDHTIKEWDRGTGVCVLTLDEHRYSVTSAVYSPDGQKILSASKDCTVKVWDRGTGVCVLTLDGHNRWVNSAVYSPDGQKILFASFDPTIKEWDRGTGICELTLAGHTSVVTSAVYSPDGQKILSASWDHTIKEWDRGTGICVLTLAGHTNVVTSAVYSPDGQKILSASWDHTIKEWDRGTGVCVLTLDGHKNAVNSAVYSPDGQKILSASDDLTIKEWDRGTGVCVLTLDEHRYSVTSAVYSPDGQKILSASDDLTIKEWDRGTGVCVLTLDGYKNAVTGAVYSPDGQKILSASWDNTIKEWDRGTGICVLTLDGHKNAVNSALYSPDGQKILSASWDNTIKEWDRGTGVCVLTLNGHKNGVKSALYSPDGQKILSASADRTIKEWDRGTGVCVLTLDGHSDFVNSAVYSPDGQKILSASSDGTFKVWDATSGTCLHTYQKKDNPTFNDFPPPKENQQLKIHGNEIIVLNPSGKGTELTIINVPGLFIQGCFFKNLDKGSQWTPKGLEILRQYGGKTGN